MLCIQLVARLSIDMLCIAIPYLCGLGCEVSVVVLVRGGGLHDLEHPGWRLESMMPFPLKGVVLHVLVPPLGLGICAQPRVSGDNRVGGAGAS